MAEIDYSLFKKYDIRGRAGGDSPALTAAAAEVIGRAAGTFFQRMRSVQDVVVGRDNRHSSPALHEALIRGLLASGCNVTDIGLVATPLVYWHSVNRAAAGIMVTGSHLGSAYNGFKLCLQGQPIWGGDIKLLAKLVQEQNFAFGQGKAEVDKSAYSSYIQDLTGRLTMARPLRVIIDPGNGMGGLFAPRLFAAWGHEVTGIYLEPDGSFPNHLPNPQESETLHDLAAAVREHGADVGIAFDGDADRMGVVDEQGRPITADRVLALLARDMLGRHPGAAVVGDVLCSQVLFDVVEAAGGQAFMAPSGHSVVKEAMRDKGALLGGEMSGHIFLAEDYHGFDDAFLAAGRVLQILAASGRTMSELDAGLPVLYSTPEYRPHCADEHKEQVIAGVAQALAGRGEIVDVDGVRVRFERGWGLLRPSNTEPVLSLRFEGETEADALAYRDLFASALRQFPQVGPLEG